MLEKDADVITRALRNEVDIMHDEIRVHKERSDKRSVKEFEEQLHNTETALKNIENCNK